MSFLERIFSRTQNPESPVKGLHPDFKITDDGYWYFNRDHSLLEEGVNLKAKFFFDNPDLLNGSKFLTKIGPNEDVAVTHQFIGFSYARETDKEKLVEWARKFPSASLITDLDGDGVSTEKTQVIELNS